MYLAMLRVGIDISITRSTQLSVSYARAIHTNLTTALPILIDTLTLHMYIGLKMLLSYKLSEAGGV